MFLASVLSVASCSIFSGCSHRSGGGNSGPADIVNRCRGEMVRQANVVGIDPRIAQGARISVRTCPEQGRSGAEGPYTCDSACSGVDGCVHGWCKASKGSSTVTYLFAGSPTDRTLRHECAHWTIIYSAGAYGHPATVTINGKKFNVAWDIAGGVRWPSIAAIAGWFTGEKNWSEDRCATFDETGTRRLFEQLEFDFGKPTEGM
jgi:hypothetical protein